MLEYIREFIHLANTMSFSKAANDLNLSQPSLRRHIADLENELGFKLFDRNPLALTAAGYHYLEGMSAMVNDIDALVTRCRSIAQGNQESLVICSIPFDLGPYSRIVYESIAHMRTTTSNFAPTFFYSSMLTIPEAVFTGKADIGIIFSIPDDMPEGFACELLMNYPGMIWAHRDNPGLKADPVKVESFANSMLVDSTNRMYSTWRDGEAEALSQAGVTLGSCLRGIENSADFFILMRRNEIKVTMDLGMDLCPYNPDVIGIRPEDPPLSINVYLLYSIKPLKPQVEAFAAVARTIACEMTVGR